MKYLISHAQKIKVCKASPLLEPQSGLTLRNGKQEVAPLLTASNTMVVMVCVENDDTHKEVKEVAHNLSDFFNSYTEVKSISLIPFAHLSEFACNDLDYVDLLFDKLRRTLSNMGLNAKSAPINQGNLLFAEWLLFERYDCVRVRNSDKNLKKNLKSLVSSFGLQKVLSTIGKLTQLKNENNNQ